MKLSAIPLFLIVGLTTAQNETAAPTQLFRCSICGDGSVPLNMEGVVKVPDGNITCEDLGFAAMVGNITSEECDQLIPLTQESCGCVQAPTGAPTITWSPTSTPTLHPTFGPVPDCFLDLDDLTERELAVQDTSIPRLYKLCANNDFVMGRNNENGPGYIGGFSPFSPRPNAIYQCGDNGLSSDNCVFTDGSFQLISFAISFFEAQTNVTFKGITFEAGYQGSMILANPGDITFDDCIIRVGFLLLDIMLFSVEIWLPCLIFTAFIVTHIITFYAPSLLLL
jgi:hypothetical protein